jgi:Uma2 family endonuclease
VLVIEVSDSALAVDLQTKGDLYRNAGIPGYWVIDVRAPQLIRVFGPDQQDPPLESLQLAVEELLLTIPPTGSTP